jgi:hypothetical protein
VVSEKCLNKIVPLLSNPEQIFEQLDEIDSHDLLRHVPLVEKPERPQKVAAAGDPNPAGQPYPDEAPRQLAPEPRRGQSQQYDDGYDDEGELPRQGVSMKV